MKHSKISTQVLEERLNKYRNKYFTFKYIPIVLTLLFIGIGILILSGDDKELFLISSISLLFFVVLKTYTTTISDEVYELARSILIDTDWYLEYTYFYNKKFIDKEDKSFLGINKGVILMVTRGIELSDDPDNMKFTGTNINFLTSDEKHFIYDIIKSRLLDDMVYKEKQLPIQEGNNNTLTYVSNDKVNFRVLFKYASYLIIYLAIVYLSITTIVIYNIQGIPMYIVTLTLGAVGSVLLAYIYNELNKIFSKDNKS